MGVLYTKEEEQLMIEALDAIAYDLRDLYNISSQDVISHNFKIGGEYGNEYMLCITDKKIYLHLLYTDYYMSLEKNGKKRSISKINNFMLLNDFLNMYSKIRLAIESKVLAKAKEKDEAMKNIQKLKETYKRDATIEIEFNGTNNKRTIELSNEDGKRIGEIRVGNETIRIITSSEIEIVNKPPTSNKVKKRGL